MGLAPDLLPGRVAAEDAGRLTLAETWGETPAARGKDTKAILEGLDSGDTRFLLMVGADPARDVPDPRQAILALESAEYLVSIDLFLNDSNRQADVVLPASGFAEKEGTVTNVEGRVQKVNVIAPVPGQARPDWAILDDLAERAGRPLGLATAESIAKEISEVAPAYAGVTWDHLDWEARDGAVVPISGSQTLSHIPVALKGDTAPSAPLLLHVGRTLYDDGVMMRHSPMLHHLAPGPVAHLNPEDAKRAGAQDGHAVKVVTSHGEGEFSAFVDEGTPEGVVYVPFNQPGAASLGTDAVVRVTAVGR
jgi:predicted molibdopterin-dependent oxidoreductase YjgC